MATHVAGPSAEADGDELLAFLMQPAFGHDRFPGHVQAMAEEITGAIGREIRKEEPLFVR
jgi:hypothetical protein